MPFGEGAARMGIFVTSMPTAANTARTSHGKGSARPPLTRAGGCSSTCASPRQESPRLRRSRYTFRGEGVRACAVVPLPPFVTTNPALDHIFTRAASKKIQAPPTLASRRSLIIPAPSPVQVTSPPHLPDPACIGITVALRRPDFSTTSCRCGKFLLTHGCGRICPGAASLLLALLRPRRTGRLMEWRGNGRTIAICSSAPINIETFRQRAIGAVAVVHMCGPTRASTTVVLVPVACYVSLLLVAVSVTATRDLGKLIPGITSLPISPHPSIQISAALPQDVDASAKTDHTITSEAPTSTNRRRSHLILVNVVGGSDVHAKLAVRDNSRTPAPSQHVDALTASVPNVGVAAEADRQIHSATSTLAPCS